VFGEKNKCQFSARRLGPGPMPRRWMWYSTRSRRYPRVCESRRYSTVSQTKYTKHFSLLTSTVRYQPRRRRTEIRECQICVNDRTVATGFPHRPVTDRCLHLPACRECIISTIRAAIDEGRWTNIICPLCPNQLEFKDIADFATDEDFARYYITLFSS